VFSFTHYQKEPLVSIGMEAGAGLDAVVKDKFPAPAGTRTPDHPRRTPALYY